MFNVASSSYEILACSNLDAFYFFDYQVGEQGPEVTEIGRFDVAEHVFHLASGRGRVVWIEFQGNKHVGEQEFSTLSRLTRLRHVSFRGCNVDSEALEAMPPSPSLRYATFLGTNIGVETLARIRETRGWDFDTDLERMSQSHGRADTAFQRLREFMNSKMNEEKESAEGSSGGG
ncbi:MAG: hypothetical protein AAF456_01990 [Planctomycetota bacterium]